MVSTSPATPDEGAPQLPVRRAEAGTSAPQAEGAKGPIQVEWNLGPAQSVGKRLKNFLTKAGLALGLVTGASHGAGKAAEGVVQDAFTPIHDTLRPGENKEPGRDESIENPENQNPENAWERTKETYHRALEWTTKAAGDTLRESELVREIDRTMIQLENFSKDVAYWGAFLVTFMALNSLIMAYLAVRKLTAKAPVDPRVEAQLRAIAESVNQMGNRLHALQQMPALPTPEDRGELLNDLIKAVEGVKVLKG